jgi:molecular chaperone DnaK
MASEQYVGIDLGTSNSAAAIFSRGRARVVPNTLNKMLTPSAVGLDDAGILVVGEAAQVLALLSPDRVATEHKRSIGSPTGFELGSLGGEARSFTAERLATQVLRSLRSDISRSLGHEARRAVISIPASFGLAESSATIRAAEAAGFERTALVQEPIAAALSLGMANAESTSARDLADGYWLVYDLGGGTFDLSLLHAEDGFLRVVDHRGDPYLGGRDIDAAVASWAARRAGWPTPRELPAACWRRLRRAAEHAKIELTHRERVEFQLQADPSLGLAPAKLELDRGQLARLASPLIERSLATSRTLLDAQRIEASSLQGLVLVGGPTVMPFLRTAITEAMHGLPILAIDPMTAVAQGAARFAATSGLPSRPASASSREARAPGESSRELRLHHPALSADPAPFVVGRVPDESALPEESRLTLIRAFREDGRIFEAEVLRDGSFCLQVHLEYGKHHEFNIEASDQAGHSHQTHPATFALTHGLHLDEAPLNTQIGIALADDRVKVYFERGIPLPARRTFKHRTVEHLAAGEEARLRIPIVQGEHDRAHLCHPVGWLELGLEAGQPALPAGSEVDLELQLDRSGRLQARARLPGGLGSIEDIERLLVPQADLESLQASFSRLRSRLDQRLGARFRESDASEPGTSVLDRIASSFAQLESELGRARTDEGDQLNRLRHHMLDIEAELCQLEDRANMAELETRALETLTWANTWVQLRGSERELELLDEVNQRMVAARDKGAAAELGRQTRLAAELGQSAWLREPRAWTQLFETLCSRLNDALDLPRAQALVERGREAAGREEWAELRSTVDALRALMPPSASLQRLAHGSAVR